MTKMYVLIEEDEDDRFGQTVMGVFSTKEKAKAYLKKYKEDMIKQGCGWDKEDDGDYKIKLVKVDEEYNR